MEAYKSSCPDCHALYFWHGWKTGIGKTPEQLEQMTKNHTICKKCGSHNLKTTFDTETELGQTYQEMYQMSAQMIGDMIKKKLHPHDQINQLAQNTSPDLVTITKKVTALPKFQLWSGSSLPNQHHYGKGGLAKHTLEVIQLMLLNAQQFPQYNLDPIELFLAGLYHDIGKIKDYEPTNKDLTDWTSAPHKRLIHHISESAIWWSKDVAEFLYLFNTYHDNVLHAILSHHMRREAGSPVAPKTRTAWMLTLCDNMSARMYDADTLDLIHKS